MFRKQVGQRIILVMMLLAPSVALAVSEHAEQEISYLLNAIARSDCRFIRNGVEYSAGEARDHMMKKYGYAKPWINTAEDFIRYAASHSSASGEPYRIRCNDRTISLSDWLGAALAEFRQRKNPG